MSYALIAYFKNLDTNRNTGAKNIRQIGNEVRVVLTWYVLPLLVLKLVIFNLNRYCSKRLL